MNRDNNKSINAEKKILEFTENKKEQKFIRRSRACRFVGERNELIKNLEKNGKLVSPQYFCLEKGGYCADDSVCIALVAQAHLPSRFGEFEISVFQNNAVALV